MTSLDNLFQCLTVFKMKKIFLIVSLNIFCFNYASCLPMHCCEETGLPGAEIPLQPKEKITVMQVVPLQPMDNHSGADSHTAAHGGPHTAAGGYILKEAAAHGEPMQVQAPGRSCGP